ncbi:MAG: UDP-2,3-diacylglucosamine diphosphatase [Bacteroidales bacterium]|nr:UDP-2,3-diacylglucosamine diphosphatase [Bacteroidales bacterium]
MAGRTGIYFTADVHLGLDAGNPADREERFVGFLKSIPRDTAEALYLLGDIWDFWYEYRDVVPKDGARALAQLIDLVDAGVKVYFFPGNHDIWTFSFFEELGIRKLEQPYYVELAGRKFCLGHGDGLSGATAGYRLMRKVFDNRILQALFSTLHPWIAYRIGKGWSRKNRRRHGGYEFIPSEEPLFRWASAHKDVDFFIFGHFHRSVDETLPNGGRFVILPSWIDDSPYLFFDGRTLTRSSFQR